MDIQRPATNKRRNRNIALIASAAAGFILLTFLAISFAGRPPGVDRDIVFDGEVTRGEFIHEITAAGNFYAPEIRSVTNQSEGVVEVIHVLAGEVVKPDDVLMQRAISWKYQRDIVRATPAPKKRIEVRFEDFVLNQDAVLAQLHSFLGMPMAKIIVRPETVGRWKTSDVDFSRFDHLFRHDMIEQGYAERI